MDNPIDFPVEYVNTESRINLYFASQEVLRAALLRRRANDLQITIDNKRQFTKSRSYLYLKLKRLQQCNSQAYLIAKPLKHIK